MSNDKFPPVSVRCRQCKSVKPLLTQKEQSPNGNVHDACLTDWGVDEVTRLTKDKFPPNAEGAHVCNRCDTVVDLTVATFEQLKFAHMACFRRYRAAFAS